MTFQGWILIFVFVGILLVLTEQHGMHTVQVGGWDAPVGITLVDAVEVGVL